MNKVNGYSVYQSNYYNNTVQNKKDTDKTQKSDSAQKNDSVKKTINNKYKVKQQTVRKKLQPVDNFLVPF